MNIEAWWAIVLGVTKVRHDKHSGWFPILTAKCTFKKICFLLNIYRENEQLICICNLFRVYSVVI